MKRYLLVLLAGATVASLLYFFGFTTLLDYVGFGSLLVGMILSGSLLPGDRMRANANYESALPKNLYLQLIVFALPFIVIHFSRY